MGFDTKPRSALAVIKFDDIESFTVQNIIADIKTLQIAFVEQTEKLANQQAELSNVPTFAIRFGFDFRDTDKLYYTLQQDECFQFYEFNYKGPPIDENTVVAANKAPKQPETKIEIKKEDLGNQTEYETEKPKGRSTNRQ